jgi:hypothetical protein
MRNKSRSALVRGNCGRRPLFDGLRCASLHPAQVIERRTDVEQSVLCRLDALHAWDRIEDETLLLASLCVRRDERVEHKLAEHNDAPVCRPARDGVVDGIALLRHLREQPEAHRPCGEPARELLVKEVRPAARHVRRIQVLHTTGGFDDVLDEGLRSIGRDKLERRDAVVSGRPSALGISEVRRTNRSVARLAGNAGACAAASHGATCGWASTNLPIAAPPSAPATLAARRKPRNSSPVRTGKSGVECATMSVCTRRGVLASSKRIASPRGWPSGAVSGWIEIRSASDECHWWLTRVGKPVELEKRVVTGVLGAAKCGADESLLASVDGVKIPVSSRPFACARWMEI